MKLSSLRPTELGAIAALATLAVAIGVGFSYGLELSVLLLAACALALVIALLWASVRNLTGDTPLSLEEALMLGAPTAEEEQKRAVLRALKDLEFERSVGKISEADYQEYSARYREQARRLIERVDASLGEAREIAEKLLNERVQQSALDETEGDTSDRDAGAQEIQRSASSTRASQKSDRAVDERATSSLDDEEDDAEDPEKEDDEDLDDEDLDDGEPDDGEPDDGEPDDGERSPKVAKAVVDPGTSQEKAASAACSACQGSNDPDAKFCKHCGAALDNASRAPRSAVAREEKIS